MDIIGIEQEILTKIRRLDKGMDAILHTANALALAEAHYERDLALAMLGIEHGTIKELDGIPIGKVTTTTLRDKAKGVAWQSHLALFQAEAAHKNAMKKIETISAQLNAWQSIFRRYDQMAK